MCFLSGMLPCNSASGVATPLSSCAPNASSSVFGVDGAVFTFLVRGVLFVGRSNLCVDVSSDQHLCVSLSASVGVFLALARELVASVRLHFPCVGSKLK